MFYNYVCQKKQGIYLLYLMSYINIDIHIVIYMCTYRQMYNTEMDILTDIIQINNSLWLAHS